MSPTSGSEGMRQPETPTGKKPEIVRVRMLGGFRVSVGSRIIKKSAWRLRKATALVKLLALAPDHRLHREQVMEALWPELGMHYASNNLHQILHTLRRALEPSAPASSRATTTGSSGYLHLGDEQLTLCPDSPLWVDVEAFEEAATIARHAKEPGAFRAAMDLYAGELLPEDRYEPWVEERRAHLRELYLSLLLELGALCEEREEFEEAIEALGRVVVQEPNHEGAHIGLMRLYALLDREVEALSQYQRLQEALSKQLGTEPSTATRRLQEDIAAGRLPASRTQPAGPSQQESPDANKHNLPAVRTSFVGREWEMMEVKRELAMTRLLTLTGAGGSGKTRLALEIAKVLVGAYPDGVWLVELAPLSEGVLVPQAVAQTLGVQEQPAHPLADTLADYLRDKHTLLVVDNCEHLVEATARLIDALLTCCPHLRILATGREPLGVAGEVIWRVSSLSAPDTDRLPTFGEMTRYDAVRLFVDRARLRQPDFALTLENGRAVAKVCGRLEGMPLAIELATARIGALAVEQISERLDDCLGLLAAGPRTAEPKHRTMRTTLEWSYGLLSEPEKKLFRRLSAFVGGWTLEAAETIGSGDGIEKGEVLDLLSRLVDKSLVVAEASAEGQIRYRMLEPVRQYGREKLEESGEADAIGRRHAAFFLALAEEAEPQLKGGGQQEAWLERLEREHSNLRTGLSWALGNGQVELALRLCGALGEFWYHRGHVTEGRRWLQSTLAQRNVASEVRQAKALALAGWLAWEQGDYEQARVLIGEGLKLYREQGDTARIAAALFDLGMVALYQTEFEQASAPLEEALAMQRLLDDKTGAARSLYALGLLAESAHQDYVRATVLQEESLALAEEVGDNYGILLSMALGIVVSIGQSDYRRAKADHREALQLSRRLKMRRMTVFQLHLSAVLASAQGQAVRTARLWGAAGALRETIGATFSPIQHYHYDPYVDAARAKLGEIAWETAFAEGQAMTTEEAVEYALSDEEPATPPPPAPQRPSIGTKSSVVLTRREREVADLVTQGLTNRQIALELSISERTVENHIGKILKKQGFSSRAQIAAWVAHR